MTALKQQRSQRGAVLVFALLLSTLLLVLGIGFMSQRELEYGSVSQLQDKAQARQLALAGMEDARVKLEKDPFFPPVSGFGQTTFTYSENLFDPEDDSRMVGVFTVTVDTMRKDEPYRVIMVQTIGQVVSKRNPRELIRGRYRIYAEIDTAAFKRGGLPGEVNPRLYQYINWKEQDSTPPTVYGQIVE